MRPFSVLILLAIFFCCSATASQACSRAVYLGPDDMVITVRSMDWVGDIGTNLWVFPRGMQRDGACGEHSAKWTSKYGSVIASAFDAATSDGMNEKGLVTSLLYLVESEYPVPGEEDDRPRVSVSVWAQYVLDNFATVNEAVEALRAEPFLVATGMTPDGHEGTVHLAISDTTGDSAIFQYIEGKLVIYHGREYQVMTNSPPFAQQLALDAYWKEIGGTVMLPGTNRSADRFVRASFYIKAIPQTTDEREAVASAFSVIRNVSVPLGFSTPGQPNISSTRWRSVCDHKNKRYYFESTISPCVFWVNLSDVNFSEGANVKKLGVSQGEIYSGNAAKEFDDAEPFKFLPADTEGPTMDVKLHGTWLLKSIEGQAVPKEVKTPSLTIAEDGKVSGFGGVNRLMGSMNKSGEKLFGPIAATMMAGPPEAMKTETNFTRALEKVTLARSTDGGLELLDTDGKVLLEFEAE
jgi:penicillin V acylase-like amidase (Ntn superfamily)/heat shock protein HslJ